MVSNLGIIGFFLERSFLWFHSCTRKTCFVSPASHSFFLFLFFPLHLDLAPLFSSLFSPMSISFLFIFSPFCFLFFCLVPNQIVGCFKWYESPAFRLALNDKLPIFFVASPISYMNMLERPNVIKGN